MPSPIVALTVPADDLYGDHIDASDPNTGLTAPYDDTQKTPLWAAEVNATHGTLRGGIYSANAYDVWTGGVNRITTGGDGYFRSIEAYNDGAANVYQTVNIEATDSGTSLPLVKLKRHNSATASIFRAIKSTAAVFGTDILEADYQGTVIWAGAGGATLRRRMAANGLVAGSRFLFDDNALGVNQKLDVLSNGFMASYILADVIAGVPSPYVKLETETSSAGVAFAFLSGTNEWFVGAESDGTEFVIKKRSGAVGISLRDIVDPSNPQDGATKAYVDAQVAAVNAGLDPKGSVRVATTANIVLSAPQTIDGVAVIAGERVLVKNQTAPEENGIYVVAAGAWTRATDFDTSAEATAGAFCFVSEGTTLGNQSWILTTNDPITLGVTGLTFAQFGAVPVSSVFGRTGAVVAVAGDYGFGLIGAGTNGNALVMGAGGSLGRSGGGTIDASELLGATWASPAAIGTGTPAAGTFTDILAGAANSIGFTGRSKIQSSADGIMTLVNAAGSDFTRVALGGLTAAFPAIARSGAEIHFRTASDSAFTAFQAASFACGSGTNTGIAARYWGDYLGLGKSLKLGFTDGFDSGTLDTALSRSAAGEFLVENGSGTPAAIHSTIFVEANTAGAGTPNVLVATETRKVLTNEGTTAENYHTLPSAAAGLEFEFYVQDSDGMRITAAAGDTIRISTGVSAAAGFIRSLVQHSKVRLVAVNATEWYGWDVGTWTIDV